MTIASKRGELSMRANMQSCVVGGDEMAIMAVCFTRYTGSNAASTSSRGKNAASSRMMMSASRPRTLVKR